MIFPITIEKVAFPKKKIIKHTIRSKSFSGWKSPKPTVDIVVKAKYITAMIALKGSGSAVVALPKAQSYSNLNEA